MSYVIYSVDSTRLYINDAYGGYQEYTTERSANSALTRMARTRNLNRDDYAIAETSHYFAYIERMVTVKNLMSGKDVVQSVNTPTCCDPSKETYWSM